MLNTQVNVETMSFDRKQTCGIRAAASLLVLAFATLIGCGDESSPTQVDDNPPPPPIEVASGAFDVTSSVLFNGCNRTEMFDGTYEIQIEDTTFSMGAQWHGTWDANAVEGFGESDHEESVIRLCTITTWTTVRVEFTSADEFSGEVVYRSRVSGSCGDRTNCQSTWRVTGVRQQTVAPQPE